MEITVHRDRLREYANVSFKKGSPFQRKQSYFVTVTVKSKDMIDNTEKHTMVLYDTTIMDAFSKVRSRYPGAAMSIRPLVTVKDEEKK